MQSIDEAFENLIRRKAIFKSLDLTRGQVKQARFKISRDRGRVSEKLKRRWLLSAGYRPAHSEMWYSPREAIRKEYEPDKYNSLDMIDFAMFFHKQSAAAKTNPEYILDKWVLFNQNQKKS